jgi:hypothetical protein
MGVFGEYMRGGNGYRDDRILTKRVLGEFQDQLERTKQQDVVSRWRGRRMRMSRLCHQFTLHNCIGKVITSGIGALHLRGQLLLENEGTRFGLIYCVLQELSMRIQELCRIYSNRN